MNRVSVVRSLRAGIKRAFILVVLGTFLLPMVLTLLYAIESPSLISAYMKDLNGALGGSAQVLFKLVPERATLSQYSTLLLGQIAYLRFYLNSVLYAVVITVGQLVVGATVAFSLSCFRLKHGAGLFSMYVVLMLLPFQITMVPNFVTLRALNLLNTYAAIWLPGIFAPFSVFLLRQYMVSIPHELLESATVDGASSVGIFGLVVLPICKPALCACGALVFADAWNMLEQPLILLKQVTLYPLSLAFFSEMPADGTGFAAAVLYMLPPLMLFSYFREDIVDGIQLCQLK